MKVRITLSCGYHSFIHTVTDANAFRSTEEQIIIGRASEWWPVSWPWADIKRIDITQDDL